MIIKILGTGCPSCKKVESIAREAVAEMGITAAFEKVTDIDRILEYPIVATPGLVIDGQLVCAGRIPNHAEVITWLQDASK
jgi:small redox-active disulfide protein 2